MIRFSVVIPVYNAAHTIRRCVQSIINNSFKNLEVILIEDGSKDNSWQVCCELADEFTNVQAVKNSENRGVSYTRNRGLELVSGEYTMFVDSDDWIDSNYYEEFDRVLNQYQTDFVVCGYINHDEKQNARVDEFGWKDFRGEQQTTLKTVIKELYDASLLQQLWNKAFRTEIIKSNGIRFDESISIGEDFRFVLDYLKMGEVRSVVMMNQPLYHYMRDQEGSLMFRVGYESIEEPLKNQRKMYEIMDIQYDEIEQIIVKERKRVKEQYAYLIMHNAGMNGSEKKRLILNLDSEEGKSLYYKNQILYIKERVGILLAKIGIRK